MEKDENSPRIIFVEGKDDRHVVCHIIAKSGLGGLGISVVDKEGINKLLGALSAEPKRPDRLAVGFVLDANDRPEGRWEAVVNRFEKEGIKFPRYICPDGTIVEANPEKRLPRIGVWLMPYNDLKRGGELEDFVLEMVPKDDPILPKAKNFIDSITADDQAFSPNKRNKAVIHAWLATRSQPGQMGSAIQRNDLQINGEPCKKFVAWVEHLFSED